MVIRVFRSTLCGISVCCCSAVHAQAPWPATQTAQPPKTHVAPIAWDKAPAELGLIGPSGVEQVDPRTFFGPKTQPPQQIPTPAQTTAYAWPAGSSSRRTRTETSSSPSGQIQWNNLAPSESHRAAASPQTQATTQPQSYIPWDSDASHSGSSRNNRHQITDSQNDALQATAVEISDAQSTANPTPASRSPGLLLDTTKSPQSTPAQTIQAQTISAARQGVLNPQPMRTPAALPSHYQPATTQSSRTVSHGQPTPDGPLARPTQLAEKPQLTTPATPAAPSSLPDLELPNPSNTPRIPHQAQAPRRVPTPVPLAPQAIDRASEAPTSRLTDAQTPAPPTPETPRYTLVPMTAASGPATADTSGQGSGGPTPQTTVAAVRSSDSAEAIVLQKLHSAETETFAPAEPQEPVEIIPFSRLVTQGTAIQTPGSLQTSAMTGPMADASVLFQKLNIDNDFREQAALIPEDVRGAVDMYGNQVGWAFQQYAWVSPTFAHRPLYFEQPNLERYGIGPHRGVRSALSAAHFFGSVVALPYKMVAAPPFEPIYTLGNQRPGDCVRHQGRAFLGQQTILN